MPDSGRCLIYDLGEIIFSWSKNSHRIKGRMWPTLLPSRESRMICNWIPLPTFQANPCPITSIDFMTAFQMTDTPVAHPSLLLIHSRIELREINLCQTTSAHKLFVEINLHETFVAKALEKMNVFFRPHPLKALGREILSHHTHGITFLTCLLLHRKEKKTLLAFSRIPFGIYDKAI